MYTDLLTILGLSFLLGVRHATDADHIVAITTIITRQKKGILSTALIGILWGLGHSITVTLVAIPIILYSVTVPPGLGLFLELIVGLMLIVLGVLNLSGISLRVSHSLTPATIHKHTHEDKKGKKHSHIHLHAVIPLRERLHHPGLFQAVRPLVVGLVHGLAGSAAIALLILSTIHNPALSVFYLFVFHTGIIAGMVIITLGIGTSLIMLKRKSAALNHYLIIISGMFSILFGLYLMYQMITNLLNTVP